MQVIEALRGIGKIIALLEENLISGPTKHQGLKHNKACHVFLLRLLLKLTWPSVVFGEHSGRTPHAIHVLMEFMLNK